MSDIIRTSLYAEHIGLVLFIGLCHMTHLVYVYVRMSYSVNSGLILCTKVATHIS